MKLPLDSAVNQPCGNFPALAGQARLCRQKAIYSEQVILLPAHCISGNGDTSIAFSRPLRAIAIALSLAVTWITQPPFSWLQAHNQGWEQLSTRYWSRDCPFL